MTDIIKDARSDAAVNHRVTNVGFRKLDDGIVTYHQDKPIVNPLYYKRIVRPDGNNTYPICQTLTPYKVVKRQRCIKDQIRKTQQRDTEHRVNIEEGPGSDRELRKRQLAEDPQDHPALKRTRVTAESDQSESISEIGQSDAEDEVRREMGLGGENQGYSDDNIAYDSC
jgi:hypothetical protein